MKRWQNLWMIVMILKLTASCSNLKSSQTHSFITPAKIDQIRIDAPDVPFDTNEAFFPLRYREDGKILPSYQWQECVNRFIVCVKWQKKIAYFENLEWFHANGFGLTKLKKR